MMEQGKTINFSVIKQKIIKTDEVLRMYLQTNDKLKKVQQAYKEIKLKYDQETLNSSRLQIESERYAFNLENMKLQNNQLEKENEELREQKSLLEEKYNQQSIQSQLNIKELEDELRLLQEFKTSETLPLKKKRNSTTDDKYEKRIRDFEEKIKELNDTETSRKSTIEQLNLRNKQLSNDIVIAKQKYSKSIQKLQNEISTLVKELNHLKLQINGSKLHNSNNHNSQVTQMSSEDKDQDIETESKTRLEYVEEENNRLKRELISKENANNIKKDPGADTCVQSDSLPKNHNRTIHIQTVETMKTVELKDLMQAENKRLKQSVLECTAEIIKLKAKSAKAKTKTSATQTEHMKLNDESVEDILKEMCMPVPLMLSPMRATSYENLNLDNTLPPILGEIAELNDVFKDIPDIIITPSTPVIEKNENFTDFIKYEEMQVPLKNGSANTTEQINMISESKYLKNPSQEIKQFSSPSVASTPVIEENIENFNDFSKSDSVNGTEQIEPEHENKICKYSSQETARVSHINESDLKKSIEPQNRDISTETFLKPIRRKKYLAPSIANNFVMLKRSCLKRLLDKKYILGKELQKLRKLRKQDCILKALRSLKDSEINFTISSESTVRNCWNDYAVIDFCPPILKGPLTSSQPVIQKHKTTKCFTEKLNCNLKCCSDSNCYMLLNNKAEPELLGFYSVKKEIITPSSSSMEVLDKYKSSNHNKLSDSTINSKTGLTTENVLDTLADLVSQKLKERDNSVPKRKRRKHGLDNSNSFCSETESEIEKSSSDVLKKHKMLLQRAKKQKERAVSDSSLVENNNSLIKYTVLDKKNTAKCQDIRKFQIESTSVETVWNLHPSHLDNVSLSNSMEINSASANSTEVSLERCTESPTILMSPSNISSNTCSDPQIDVLPSCHFIPCNESTNGSDSFSFSVCPQLLSPICSVSSKSSPRKDSGKVVNFEGDQLKENKKVVSGEMVALNEKNINFNNFMENSGLVIQKDMSSVMPFSDNADINTENIFKHTLLNNHSSLDINIPNIEPVPGRGAQGTIQQRFLSIKQNLLLENNFEKKNDVIKIGQHLNSFYAGPGVNKEISFINTSNPIQSIEEKLNMQEYMPELKNIENIPSCPESPSQKFSEINFSSPTIIPLEKDEADLCTSPELTGIRGIEFFKPLDCEKEQNITEEENVNNINFVEFHSTNSKINRRPASPKVLRRSLRNVKKQSSQISHEKGIEDSTININDRLIDPGKMKDDIGTSNVKSRNLDKSNSCIGRCESIKLEPVKRKIGRPKKCKSNKTKHNGEETDNLSLNAINSSKEALALNAVSSLKSELKISPDNLNSQQESKASSKETMYTEDKTFTMIAKNSLPNIAQTSTTNLVETNKLLGCSLPESNREKSIQMNNKTLKGMTKSTTTTKRKTMSKLKSNILREVNIRRKMLQNNEITYAADRNSTSALECNKSNRTSMDLEATNVNVGISSASNVARQNNVSEDTDLKDSTNRRDNEKIHIVQNILIPANSNQALDLLHQQELSEGVFATNCDIRFGMKQNSSQNIVDIYKRSIEKNNINDNSNNICKAPIRRRQNISKSKIADNNSTDILSKIMDEMDKDKPKKVLESRLEPKNKLVNVYENVTATIGDKEWRNGFISIAEKIYNASNKEDGAVEILNNNQKLLTKPSAKPSKKEGILMSRLLKLSSEENIPDEIILEFKRYEVDNIAELILQSVSKDVNDKPDDKYYPAPLMTETQRLLLKLMVQLEKENVKMLMDKFLSKAETFLFKVGCGIRTVVPITRLYMAVCKLRADITQMRIFCWNAFYFMCDLAIPLLFTILTSWTEVLPKESDLKNYPLAKVLVQIVHLKGCNKPGYNLLPLRFLLNQFYGYPKERWNCDEIFEEVFQHYLRKPVKSSDLALRSLCKNKDTNWVYKKINEFFKPLIYKIPSGNVNFKATAILLIGNICRQFKPQNQFDKTCLVELRRWLIGLIEDGDAPDLIKQSVYLCLTRLPKNRVKTKKVKKQTKKQTTKKKFSIQKKKKKKALK